MKKRKKRRGGAREGAGRPPSGKKTFARNVTIEEDAMALYAARIEQTGRTLHAELRVAIRRHVGLE